MTNVKVYQGFLDDKKVEEHCANTMSNSKVIKSKISINLSLGQNLSLQ